tara:strand:+ start:345 stop:704 length:360 start_codon:yes stop_codon:yes gene_type:complete
MMQFIFRFLSFAFACMAIWQFIADRMSGAAYSTILGQVWFSNSPSSLQIAEAVVERYMDPCSVILFLGCSPFLWHPGISTILRWPAVLVFAAVSGVFFIFGQRASRRTRRKHPNLYKDS